MSTSRLALAVLAGVVLCAPAQAYTFRGAAAPDADLAAPRTWAWTDDAAYRRSGVFRLRELLADRIEAALRSEMDRRGLAETSRAEADLLLSYHGVIEEKSLLAGGISQDADPFYDRRFGMPRDTWMRNLSRGTLTIEVLDAKTGDLLWRGWVQEMVKPDQLTGEHVGEALEALFRLFPRPLTSEGDPAAEAPAAGGD